MKTLNLIVFSADDIVNDKIEEVHEALFSVLRKEYDINLVSHKHIEKLDAASFSMILISSGNVGNEIINKYENLPHPLYIVVDGKRNSLGVALEVLAWQAVCDGLLPEGCRHIVPLVDARRMEVYTAVFSTEMRRLDDVRPMVVDGDSFADILAEGPVLFIGDGAEKCSQVISSPNARFVQACPRAASMLKPAEKALAARDFKDTAYFEPFYLKQFQATVSKKKIF